MPGTIALSWLVDLYPLFYSGWLIYNIALKCEFLLFHHWFSLFWWIYPDILASLEDGGDVAEILRAEGTSRKAWLHSDVCRGTEGQGRSVDVWNDGRQFPLDWFCVAFFFKLEQSPTSLLLGWNGWGLYCWSSGSRMVSGLLNSHYGILNSRQKRQDPTDLYSPTQLISPSASWVV